MLSKLFLESPWMLLIALVSAEVVLIVVWLRRRGRLCGRLVCAGLAAIAAIVILSELVVTPRERIIALCHDLATAVELADVSTIRQRLTADFEAGGFDAPQFTDRLQQTLTRYRVIDPRLYDFELVFPSDDVGVVTFGATCRVESAEGYFDRLSSRWRLTLRRSGGSWKLAVVETLPVPPLYVRNVRELLR